MTRRRTDYVIEYNGYPVGSIIKAFRETTLLAGFAPGDVVPYTLRHTAATWIVQRGVPLWEIAGFLGHSDTCMVEKHYAHHHPDNQCRPAAAITEALAEARFAPHLHPTP